MRTIARRAAAASWCALALAALTGCGSGAGAEAGSGLSPTVGSSTSSSASAAASSGAAGGATAAPSDSGSAGTSEPLVNPDGLEAPELPRATDDAAGREAFAAYVTEAYVYGFRTNDPQPFQDMAAAGDLECPSCTQLVETLGQHAADGYLYPGLRFTGKDPLLVARAGADGVWEYVVQGSATGSPQVDRTGDSVGTLPAETFIAFDLGFRYLDDAYQLTGYQTETS